MGWQPLSCGRFLLWFFVLSSTYLKYLPHFKSTLKCHKDLIQIIFTLSTLWVLSNRSDYQVLKITKFLRANTPKGSRPVAWNRGFTYSSLSPSESASRLQTILNEIQPRDTNDYFNQAKILKERDSFDLEDLNTSVPNIDTSAEIKGNISNQCFTISL